MWSAIGWVYAITEIWSISGLKYRRSSSKMKHCALFNHHVLTEIMTTYLWAVITPNTPSVIHACNVFMPHLNDKGSRWNRGYNELSMPLSRCEFSCSVSVKKGPRSQMFTEKKATQRPFVKSIQQRQVNTRAFYSAYIPFAIWCFAEVWYWSVFRILSGLLHQLSSCEATLDHMDI